MAAPRPQPLSSQHFFPPGCRTKIGLVMIMLLLRLFLIIGIIIITSTSTTTTMRRVAIIMKPRFLCFGCNGNVWQRAS